MVLVHRKAIEANLVGVFHQIEEHVVDLPDAKRVVQMCGGVYPGAVVLLREVLWQVGVGDLREPVKLHPIPPGPGARTLGLVGRKYSRRSGGWAIDSWLWWRRAWLCVSRD